MYRCKTCKCQFAPHESVKKSTEFCSPACRDAWSAYRKRLKGYEERKKAFEEGRTAKKPNRPKDLRIPTPEERAESRKVALELRAQRKERKEAMRLRGEMPVSEEGAGTSYHRIYHRVCHICGRPSNNYWCPECWKQRRRKYHITDISAWGHDNDI